MSNNKKSRLPARLDFVQSASGLVLGIFICFHLIFESSILISNDFMLALTKFFEASFIFDGGEPLIISALAFIVFVIFIVHAALGMRKLPANYKQYKIIKEHGITMNHEDTRLWFLQAITGFAMFFLGSVHLYIVMTQPGNIGPFASSDRIWSEWMWPLYLMLLISVVIHAMVGLYRLVIKWGVFDGPNPKKTRMMVKNIARALVVFYLVLGLTSLATYMKIGYQHAKDGKVGEKYHTTTEVVK